MPEVSLINGVRACEVCANGVRASCSADKAGISKIRRKRSINGFFKKLVTIFKEFLPYMP
jgi:hypothetical protein